MQPHQQAQQPAARAHDATIPATRLQTTEVVDSHGKADGRPVQEGAQGKKYYETPSQNKVYLKSANKK
jgi:hypothetical protein